jgi:multidrug efflux pump subunit AcrB
MEQSPKKNVIREFGLTNVSVKNRTLVIILTIVVAAMGVFSYTAMPKEQFPEVKLPTFYVRTPYPGTAPFDIENLITRPLEQEINTISDVREIKSTSIQDFSIIIIEFQPNVESSEAKQEVKDAVDRAEPELPSDLDDDPRVLEVNTAEIPVMNINIAGDMPRQQLKEHAEYLQDEIEQLPSINEAQRREALDQEIEIRVDPYKMQARQVSFTDVENAVRRENTSLSGGELTINNYDRSLRIIGEFESHKEMGNIIVSHEKGNIVYLKDIAQAVLQFEEPTSIARADGSPVISLDVIKKSDGNLVQAANKIQQIIGHSLQNEFPESIEITTTNNQADRTNQLLSNLESNITSGVILVVLVLLPIGWLLYT